MKTKVKGALIVLSTIVIVITLLLGPTVTTCMSSPEVLTTNSPPFIVQIHVRPICMENHEGARRYYHEMIVLFGDPDGIDDLLTNGQVNILFFDREGNSSPPEEYVWNVVNMNEFQLINLMWGDGNEFPSPEDAAGQYYYIKIWDNEGNDVTYTTTPTLLTYYPTTFPHVTFPPNYGAITETIPIITWEPYTENDPFTTANYGIRVVPLGDGWAWDVWPLDSEITSIPFNFDHQDGVPYSLSFGGYWLKLSADQGELTVYSEPRYYPEYPFEYTFVERVGRESHKGIIFYVTPYVCATVDIDPDTLNLKSKGKWITCYIELPEGYEVEDINVGTILLENFIPAEASPSEVGDNDSDGIPDLMVKFDRRVLIDYLGETTGDVILTVTGEVEGIPFLGSDTIKVIEKGKGKGKK